MKTFFIFTDKQGNEITGSDQLFRPDQRLTLYNKLAEAQKRAEQLSNVKPFIAGVNIYVGSIRKPKFVDSFEFSPVPL